MTAKVSKYLALKSRVFAFFEQPKSLFARAVHIFIVLLIVLSGVLMVIEHGYPDIYSDYAFYLNYADWVILGVFTVEYVLRFWSSPKKAGFFFGFYNLIDFFAVAPMYLGLGTSGIRSLRLFRLLRLSRMFRVFKLFRYSKFFGALFKMKGTVLEKIIPVITLFTVLKFVVYFLEVRGWWISNYSLETIFTVIGFALGIILSQKIGVAYTKFILLEDAVTKIHGFIISINSVLREHHKGKKGASKVVQEWVDAFHHILLRKRRKADFYVINEKLYKEIHKLISHSHGYAELIRVYSRLNEEASFMLNRMDALTPKAYDQILHRSTLLYSLLLIIFLPGITGIVATVVSTYVLYGLYQVTDEMDNAMTHLEDQLVNADIEDLVMLKRQLQ